jgi:hypothetical protein
LALPPALAEATEREQAGPPPPTSPPVDPLRELRRQRKPTRAALVEYMWDRDSATYEEIATHVHGDVQTSGDAIWKNVQRTNEDLAEMAFPIRYRCASSMVHKETPPE